MEVSKMFRKLGMWFVIAGTLAGSVGIARADDIAELRILMEQQYEQMRQMHNKLIELEAAQKQQAVAVQKLEESEGTMTLPETLAWLEDIKFYGDFRYRYEYRDRDWKSDTSDRHRIRARIGLKYDINDEFMFDFRVATAEFFDDDDDTNIGGDYVSGNKSLGDYWASKNLWVDRAYVAYAPNWADGVTALFGKMGNPFYKVGKNQLIWDGDLNPEGIALQYKKGDLFVNGMFGMVQENGSNSDKEMLGIQAGVVHAFADDSQLIYGAGYFDYMNVEGEEAIIDDAFAGNTSTDGTTYDFDYDMIEIFGEYATKVGELPVSVYGNYVLNTASDVKEDTGWLVGTKLGKAKGPGSWEFSYNYRDIEADAVFGAFTDSDFADGGTNAKGHVFGVGYALAKNTTLAATYFMNDALDEKPDDDYDRLQLDLKVKF
ncbi:MAG: putative porin [Planctomycetota bacterium]